jgi:hypothetical protein
MGLPEKACNKQVDTVQILIAETPTSRRKLMDLGIRLLIAMPSGITYWMWSLAGDIGIRRKRLCRQTFHGDSGRRRVKMGQDAPPCQLAGHGLELGDQFLFIGEFTGLKLGIKELTIDSKLKATAT